MLNQNLKRRLDRKYVSSTVEIGDSNIVLLMIDRYKKYPLTADGRFYIRHQDEDHLLNPHEVWELMNTSIGAMDSGEE
ncbi:hypothetical protein LC1Hm_0753 [Halomicrobium sp. LC1Hm]|nr:hypothetical protein LC1Hm_0753 [Halomicrobium sp. LC1Hm]